jgi:hypothetical protein
MLWIEIPVAIILLAILLIIGLVIPSGAVDLRDLGAVSQSWIAQHRTEG